MLLCISDFVFSNVGATIVDGFVVREIDSLFIFNSRINSVRYLSYRGKYIFNENE